jgi:hypothetical protein
LARGSIAASAATSSPVPDQTREHVQILEGVLEKFERGSKEKKAIETEALTYGMSGE